MDVNVSTLVDWFNVMANGRFSQLTSYIYEYALLFVRINHNTTILYTVFPLRNNRETCRQISVPCLYMLIYATWRFLMVLFYKSNASSVV